MEGITAIVFVAMKTIHVNEELTTNYNWDSTTVTTKCNCKKPGCRRIIEKKLSINDNESKLNSLEKAIDAGIHNNKSKKGSICYFSSIVQLFFRGTSFDVVKKKLQRKNSS